MFTAENVLQFSGPFGLTEGHVPVLFEDPCSMQPGIYFWTVPYVKGGLIITYVGETSSTFGRRMKEHMIQTVGGNYRISDPELLLQGVDHVLWNGLWRKGTQDKMPEYLERLVDLAPAIERTFGLARIFVAPFHSPKRLRQRIEASLAQHIRNQPPPGSSLLPGDIRYYQRRTGEEPVLVHVQCREHVLGLPCDIEA
jgi:hypothetical protein